MIQQNQNENTEQEPIPEKLKDDIIQSNHIQNDNPQNPNQNEEIEESEIIEIPSQSETIESNRKKNTKPNNTNNNTKNNTNININSINMGNNNNNNINNNNNNNNNENAVQPHKGTNNNGKIKTSEKNDNISNLDSLRDQNNIYENFDIEKMTYSIMKNYLQIKINKEKNFMERMKFDTDKRQLKDEKIKELIEHNKIKIDEKDRVKAFNRLIEDSNRRIEAQEKLDMMKSKLEEFNIPPPKKKYKQDQWKNIYEERFKKFEDEKNKKNIERIKEKQIKAQQKEQKEIELCKTKKASKADIERATQRLYEDSLKRQIKNVHKPKKGKENSPRKFNKTSSYNMYAFDSDNENSKDREYNNLAKNLNPNLIFEANLEGQDKFNNKDIKKDKKMTVSQYNNKRFEAGVKGKQPINKNNKKNKDKGFPIAFPNRDINKYLKEEESEERNAPQPVSNSEFMSETDNLDSSKSKTLAKKSIIQNSLATNSWVPYQGNARTLLESDASKIVDYFFTQNLKGI